MLNATHPFIERRQALGLSLMDVQSQLRSHGFNYSIDMIRAIEQGERGFPIGNPGFALVISKCLSMPVMSVHQTARQVMNDARSQQMFSSRIQRLCPQNQVLLRFVLRHPDLMEIPGFNTLFEIVKSIALQLPDEWFRS